MQDVLVNAAYDIFSILLPVLAILLAEWLRRKIGSERLQRIQRELETKQELAFLAVQFVEQAFKDIKGYEKYNEAAHWLVMMLNERNINIDGDEVKGLIESSLRTFKDTFGEEWARSS